MTTLSAWYTRSELRKIQGRQKVRICLAVKLMNTYILGYLLERRCLLLEELWLSYQGSVAERGSLSRRWNLGGKRNKNTSPWIPRSRCEQGART
jgi:hypothetical protein